MANMMEYAIQLDRLMEKFVNSFAHVSLLFDNLVVILVSMYFIRGGVFVAALWWIWFSKRSPRSGAQDNRMLVARAIMGGLTAIAVGRILQMAMPERPRPMHDPQLGFQLPYGANPADLQGWSSFPSDHAVLFFALSTALFLWSRTLGVIAFVWTTVIVCLPRNYMGLHFPGDIIVGAVIGVAIMLAAQRIALPSDTAKTISRYESEYSAAFYTLAFFLTYQIAILFYDVRHFGSLAAMMVGLGS